MMKLFFTVFFVLLISGLFAQDPNCFPDGMEEISVSGVVTVDSSFAQLKYYLDVDDDEVYDYKLNFGPYWYEPETSDALRPEDGDAVDIFGSVHMPLDDTLQVIIVYEINDLLWRDPYVPNWNPQSHEAHKYERAYRNHRGFASGWYSDTLETTELQGYVLIDSTCYYWHYYLDVEGDTIPEYVLNFGPPWYENPDGLVKPAAWDFVTVSGLLFDAKLLVLTLNGETWYEPKTIDNPMGGTWIHRHMHQNSYVYTPFDTLSRLTIRTGWHDQLPDSLYCQMLRLFPQNIPFAEGEHAFAGYEIGVFNRNRQNLMMRNDSIGDKLQFASQLHYRFHFENAFRDSAAANNFMIQCKVYNNQEGNWETITDAVIDYNTNTVSFESDVVSSLIILTYTESATALSDMQQLPLNPVLKQNYPNPFNPLTIIEFYIPEKSNVVLNVYNILGQNVATLVNADLNAGLHHVKFDAGIFSSGVYFYELKNDGKVVDIKKMSLLR